MAMFVREFGPADAPTIVMLPGGGTGGWYWLPQVEQLPDYHILVPDLPEQGRSIGEGPFTIPDAAARVAELIQSRAHGGHAHLAGLSLGGQTVLELLRTRQDLVDRALISGANVRGLRGAWLVNAVIRLSLPLASMRSMVRASMKHAGIQERFLEDMLREGREATADSMSHVVMESLRYRILPGLERITRPLLVLAGAREPRESRESVRDILAAIPGAVGRFSRDGLHTWNQQFPERFTATIRAWIQGGDLPAELEPIS